MLKYILRQVNLSLMIKLYYSFTNASCDTTSDWCSIEHWTTLGCLYLGAVFYSLLISSISSIIQTASLASRHFEEKLIQLDDYMRSRKLPAPLREKVKDYFHLQHADGKLFNEREILDMVTPILRREIQEFNGRGVAEKVPLLSSVSHKLFANELGAVIQSTIAFTDEILMKEGTVGDEMYFVNSGVLDIYVNDEKANAYCTIGDGCVSIFILLIFSYMIKRYLISIIFSSLERFPSS